MFNVQRGKCIIVFIVLASTSQIKPLFEQLNDEKGLLLALGVAGTIGQVAVSPRHPAIGNHTCLPTPAVMRPHAVVCVHSLLTHAPGCTLRHIYIHLCVHICKHVNTYIDSCEARSTTRYIYDIHPQSSFLIMAPPCRCL